MKRVLVFLFLGIIAAPAQTNPPINSVPTVQSQIMQPMRVQEDLLGKVMRVESQEYKMENGSKGELSGHELTTFDQAGFYLESSHMDKSGTMLKTSYTYDAKGNLSQKIESSSLVSAYKFDPASRTVTCQSLERDGSPGAKTVSIYDATGREHEVTHLDASGQQIHRATFERNSAGKEVTVKFFDQSDAQTVEIDVTWNNDGSVHEKVTHNLNGDQAVFDSKYDYPAHDDHGNWTQQVETTSFTSKNGDPIGQDQHLTERTLTYY